MVMLLFLLLRCELVAVEAVVELIYTHSQLLLLLLPSVWRATVVSVVAVAVAVV